MSNERDNSGLIGLLDRALVWVSLICGGVTLAFMTGFSVWNVLIMRKALNSPIVGAEDLLILALVVIVALSIPLGARTGAHIEIEVLESHMSAGFAKWSMVFVKVLGAVLLAVDVLAALARRPKRRAFRRDDAATADFLRAILLPACQLQSRSTRVVVVLDIWQLLRGDKIALLKMGGDPL